MYSDLYGEAVEQSEESGEERIRDQKGSGDELYRACAKGLQRHLSIQNGKSLEWRERERASERSDPALLYHSCVFLRYVFDPASYSTFTCPG